MNRHLFVSLCITAGLSGISLEARADQRADLESDLAYFVSDADPKEIWSANGMENWRTPDDCRSRVAKAKKRGYKDADAVGGAICDTFEAAYERQKLRRDVQFAYDREASGNVGTSENPKACLAALDKLDGDIVITEGMKEKTVTIDEARTLCTAILEESKAFEAAGGDGPNRADIEAKWKKVGMKGDRLALFVDNELNGGGFPWYAAGCEKEIKDPKKLAKAKKLFMWTAGANGGTLVTKIVFKGNKYTESSSEFFNEAKAYRWCK